MAGCASREITEKISRRGGCSRPCAPIRRGLPIRVREPRHSQARYVVLRSPAERCTRIDQATGIPGTNPSADAIGIAGAR